MITEKRPVEFFREMVSAAIRRQRVKAAELTEFYLSGLLESFVTTGRLTDEPLAISYLKALQAERNAMRRILQELGDISLFTSGFFSDSLKRKIIDIDYYINMGTVSYSRLASMHTTGGALGEIFNELAEKFTAFVDVLAEVSERTRITSSEDILRLYERWLRTKSRRTESLLRELGIDPVDVNFTRQ